MNNKGYKEGDMIIAITDGYFNYLLPFPCAYNDNDKGLMKLYEKGQVFKISVYSNLTRLFIPLIMKDLNNKYV